MSGKLFELYPYSGLASIVLVYLILTVFTGLRSPLSAGPDEVAHFMFARFLRQAGYLPLTPEDRETAGYKSDQPPLNAALVALAAFGANVTVPPFVKMTHDIPRRHLAISVDKIPNWLVLNTEDPWRGEILLWRIGRLLSVIFSAGTLVVIYCLALLVFEDVPARYLAASAVTMSVAFIPTFVFMSSVLSYENLLGLWLALYLLIAVYLIKKGGSGWLYLLAGLFVGLAIVTKLSALTAPLSLAALVLLVGFRAGWPLRKYLLRLGASLVGLLAGAGWWFALIELYLNRVNELGWVSGLMYPILIADGSDETSVEISYLLTGGKIGEITEVPDRIYFYEWLERLFRSFWQFHWQFDSLIFWGLLGLAALMLIGLVRVWRQNPAARLWLILLPAHISIFLILPLIRFFSVQETSTAQGQHMLFPALGAFAVLMTWGLSAWFPARSGWPWLGGFLLGLAMLVWSIVQIGQIYQPPLPVRTIPPLMPASAQAHELNFGTVVLAGYELEGLRDTANCCRPDYPALKVDLYWVAQEYSQENYQSEVSLVDSQGQTQSIWRGFPANGRYPAKAWDPDDSVRDEVWLPLLGLSPGTYTVRLRLLADQGPVSVENQSDFTLARIVLPEPVTLPGITTASDVHTYELWQQGRIAGGLPTFEARSTIQITAGADAALSLVGPNEVAWPPEQVAGRTHVFIVDPRWPRGEYRLRIESSGQPAWVSAPILYAQGEGRPTSVSRPQTVVDANFANQLLLSGYDLPQRRVMPGDPLPVTLNWQALHSMPADFIMFTRLYDEAGQVWGGYDRKAREGYSTLLWVAGEVVEDGFTLPIKEDTPPGLYYLDVGWYLPVGQAPVSLPLVQDGQMSQVTSVTLGPIKVGHPTSGLTVTSANPQHLLDQPFGDTPPAISLLGYDLEPFDCQQSIENCQLSITLYWRSEMPVATDYTVFVHIRNAADETVVQKDQPPLNGAYPTNLWDPGDIIADKLTVPLPTPPPPGQYQIVVGLYDFQTGQRLTVPGISANEVSLTNVEFR